MQHIYIFTSLAFLVLLFTGFNLTHYLKANLVLTDFSIKEVAAQDGFNFNSKLTELFTPKQVVKILLEGTRGSYNNIGIVESPTVIKCQGQALCLKGEVVKVANGKSFFVSVNNRIMKIDLALIDLPVTDQQAMMAATTFTRNNCLGGTVLIDQDDGQKGDSIIGTVYCSPTKSLNSLLLDTGYVNLNKTQCLTSEFSKLDWARSHGC